MTVKLSSTKITKIFRLYFQGFTQTAIAGKLGIDQTTVWFYLAEFTTMADEEGLLATAKEFGIMEIVKELHSLGAELKKSGRTVEEAKTGHKMLLLFQKCGVEEDEFADLIQACKKMDNEGNLFASIELSQLEDENGTSYEGIVADFKSTSKQLAQAKKEAKNIHGEINSSNEELEKINKQKKLANQDLKAHMDKVGVDMHRLEMVEALALALKEETVTDQELAGYIQRQELLNKAGIGINVFAKILEETKTATYTDNGKKLFDMLAEYNSLAEGIHKLQTNNQTLTKELSNLKQVSTFKGKLVGEINKLEIDLASLEGHVVQLKEQEKENAAQLEENKNELEVVINSVYTAQDFYNGLTEKKKIIEYEISQKQNTRDSLDEEIKLKNPKVSDLNLKHEQLVKEDAELELKVNKEKARWKVFEGFLGLVNASSIDDLRKAARTMPKIVEEAQDDKYKPEFLKNSILKDLAGPGFQTLRCTSCDLRFAVGRSASKDANYHCPICGMLHSVTVDKDVGMILKEALANANPQIIVKKITPRVKPSELKGEGKA